MIPGNDQQDGFKDRRPDPHDPTAVTLPPKNKTSMTAQSMMATPLTKDAARRQRLGMCLACV